MDTSLALPSPSLATGSVALPPPRSPSPRFKASTCATSPPHPLSSNLYLPLPPSPPPGYTKGLTTPGVNEIITKITGKLTAKCSVLLLAVMVILITYLLLPDWPRRRCCAKTTVRPHPPPLAPPPAPCFRANSRTSARRIR